MRRIMTDPSKTLTNGEKAVINKALIRLRDYHLTQALAHSKPNGDIATFSRNYAEQIDALRGKVLEL